MGQISQPNQITPVIVDPSGSCPSQFKFQYNYSSTGGTFWACKNGVWTALSGGAGGGMAIGGAITGATAGSVLFADALGQLGQDNSNFFRDSTTGFVGIGTPTPGNRLSVRLLSTDATNTEFASGNAANYTPSADTGAFKGSAVYDSVALGTKNWTGSWGSGGLYGFLTRAINNGTGTVANAYGNVADVQNLAAGHITNSFSQYIPAPFAPSGSIVNAYGLYIENINTGTSLNYAIYDAGGLNYFAGITLHDNYTDDKALVAPATPGTGYGRVYIDSTSKNLAVKDDAGVIKHGIQTKVAVTHNFATAVSDAGVLAVAQPAAADLGDGLTGTGLVVLATAPTLTHAIWNAGTPLNSWVNFGAPYGNLQYTKDIQGFVWCRGTLKNGTSTDGTVLFTLPAGFRPPASVSVVTIGGSAVAAFSQLVIDTSGNVSIFGSSGYTFVQINVSFDTAS